MKKLFVALAIAGIALSARAQTTYTSRTLYDLAHPGNFVIDFNGYTPASFQYASVTAPTPGGNVTFAGIQGNIEFLGSSNIGFLGAGNLALYDLSGQFLAESLRVTLPANTFSFGTDLISPSQTIPEPYTINI